MTKRRDDVAPVRVCQTCIAHIPKTTVSTTTTASAVSSISEGSRAVRYAPDGLAPAITSAMRSALRSVSAENVNVPLVQPAVGSVGEPTTNRFS